MTTATYRNPALTVDALVAKSNAQGSVEILLIKRGKEPFKDCWAIPGGFVDYGESPEVAVIRELAEETHLKACDPRVVAVRGDPERDPRQHIVTIAYALKLDASSLKDLRGDDDASDAVWFALDSVCDKSGPAMAFDHLDLAWQFRKWLTDSGVSGAEQGYVLSDS
eukprot:Partr_v1_DN26368_c1_g1_i1_m42953